MPTKPTTIKSPVLEQPFLFFTKRMATSRQKKTQQLEKLTDGFKNAKGAFFAANTGLSVSQAEALRNALRGANCSLVIAKKTLIRKAAAEAGTDIPAEQLPGAVGVAFSFDDEVSAARELQASAKETEKLEIVAGLIDGSLLSAPRARAVASLPAREVLLGKFLGSAVSPLSSFVGMGSGLLSSFARVLSGRQSALESAGNS